MNDREWLTERFEEHRPHLQAIAYRMLGSVTEADDALQEVWLRIRDQDSDVVENMQAWLTTVVGRVCLNMLRSRRTHREKLSEFHVPDPIVSLHDPAGPEHEALLAESVGLALLVVLDALGPAERLAFVLHDVFGVSFSEIATLLERSEAAAQQLASRARRRVQNAPEPDRDLAHQKRLVDAFFAAARDGDLDSLVQVLHPDVVLRIDGGRLRREASLVLRGAEAVSRHTHTYSTLHPHVVTAFINGTPGALVVPNGRPFAVMGFTISHHRITEIDVLLDPESWRASRRSAGRSDEYATLARVSQRSFRREEEALSSIKSTCYEPVGIGQRIMGGASRTEAKLVDANHLLVALGEPERLDFDFFGSVLTVDDLAAALPLSQQTVYLIGDISRLPELDLTGASRVLVIEELSRGYEDQKLPLVNLGQVPVRVGGAGVYYRRFFDEAGDDFHRICAEHTFQALTESVKPSKAYRTGIYMTPVTQEGDALHFHLLRCSTNLSGPTENFCATDHRIVDALNREAAVIFRDHAPLNHVLAQVYANTPANDGQKQTKAKISAHADKTKDMPVNGIMAFCTFYDGLAKLGPLATDPFDYGYKGKTGLTKLRFRLKEAALDTSGLLPEFSLTLYPGSVFFMPLSTNRLYTHEIQSSMLNAEMLPTRLGYVVRCSKTEAIHESGTTFLKIDGHLVPMEPPLPDGTIALRELYAAENKTDAFIDYGDRFRFSMNEGDYKAPDPKRG